MAFGIRMFLLLNTGLVLFIVAAVVISYAVCQNSLAGAQGAWFPDLFDAKSRSSGASLAYQISRWSPVSPPFITTLLYLSFGWMGFAQRASFLAALLDAGVLGVEVQAAPTTSATTARSSRPSTIASSVR